MVEKKTRRQNSRVNKKSFEIWRNFYFSPIVYFGREKKNKKHTKIQKKSGSCWKLNYFWIHFCRLCLERLTVLVRAEEGLCVDQQNVPFSIDYSRGGGNGSFFLCRDISASLYLCTGLPLLPLHFRAASTASSLFRGIFLPPHHKQQPVSSAADLGVFLTPNSSRHCLNYFSIPSV